MLFAALSLAVAFKAGAQPAVGTVATDAVSTSRGYSIPLPPGRWRVTLVTDQTSGPNTFKVAMLRSEEADPLIPYVVVRWALNDSAWTDFCSPNGGGANAFNVDRLGTLPNQLLFKCARNFAFSVTFGSSASDWWKGLDAGVLDADRTTYRGESMAVSELTVFRWRGLYARVEAFVRTGRHGAGSATLRDDARAGRPHLWNSTLQAWNAQYVNRMEEAVLQGRRVQVAALDVPSSAALDEKIRQVSAQASPASPPQVARPTPVIPTQTSDAVPAHASVAAVAAPAQACPFRLVVTHPDGSKSCLRDMPLGQRMAPGSNVTVADVAARSNYWVVALPTSPGCQAVGIDGGATFATVRGNAIRYCELGGCACELAIDAGTVVSARGQQLLAQHNVDLKRAQTAVAPAVGATAVQPAVAANEESRRAQAQVQAPRPVVAMPAPAALPAPSPAAVAAPSVSAQDLARLSAEIARLREDLKARPAAEEAPAAARQQPAPATPVAAGGGARRLALVIGNDGYQGVSKLQNARTDARAMGEQLTRMGYRVRVRTDLGERAMKDELRAFKGEVQGGDEVVFFFAGHGVQLGGSNYLLPTDIRGDSEDQVRDDALPLQKVLDDLQERKARFALAIVDACRDNPFKSSAGRNIGTRGLAPTSAATGQMVMFSAGAGQQALDRLGDKDRDPNGLFTRVLLREIDKPGVSVDRVLRTVRAQVVEMARSVGHEQVPALYDQTVGEFYFKR